MKITCLHTADSNRVLFDLAAAERGFSLTHMVRPDLLAAAEAAGSLTPAIILQTNQLLAAAMVDADIVILTCSTLGPCIHDSPHIIRADLALAQIALQRPGDLAVLYTAPTSRKATEGVFEQVAKILGRAPVTCHLVPEAWPAFKAGAQDQYFHLIAQAADHALAQGAKTVALAQASMAPARALTQRPADVLSVIDAALERAGLVLP